MSEEEIDYKALYEAVEKELTEARLKILSMRLHPIEQVDMDSLRYWIQKNYIVIVVSIMLATFILSSLKTVKEVFRRESQR